MTDTRDKIRYGGARYPQSYSAKCSLREMRNMMYFAAFGTA
jgi:hypothetical protein